MDQLKQQVRRARSRLNAQQFVRIVIWSMFAWLIVAAFALAVPKIWAFGWNESQAQVYAWSIIGGGLALAVLTAGLWTWLVRRGEMEAAIELDRRFGLKERVSSALALAEADRETEFGRALVADTVRRVERIDVRQQFGVRASWFALLPLLPAAIVFVLALAVPDAVNQAKNTANAKAVQAAKVVKTSTDNLKKKLAEQRKEAEEKGLVEASDLLTKLEKGLDRLKEQNSTDKKKAMVELNNLAAQIKDRTKQLRDSEQLKEQMNALKDMKQGPADKLAQALKDGKFEKALEELNKLQDELKKGNLNAEQKEQLQKQLAQMKDKLQQVADAKQQAQKELQQQIDQAKQQGDLTKAGELQQQLDKLQQQSNQDKLQQMADKLGECSQCMQNGDAEGAAKQLQELAQELQQMENAEAEMQTLEEALDQIAKAKDAMNGEGEGSERQGNEGDSKGNNGMKNQNQRRSAGRGGLKPGVGSAQNEEFEEEQDQGLYDSTVRGQVTGGKAQIVGEAGGANKAGQAREEIRNEIHDAREGTANPLTNERLPRSQREHVKEYYDAFRSGK